MVLEVPKNVDLRVINRVESIKISFVRANDILLLDEDGVQIVLDLFCLNIWQKRRHPN